MHFRFSLLAHFNAYMIIKKRSNLTISSENVRSVTELLPNTFQQINCSALASESATFEELSIAKNWTYEYLPDHFFHFIKHDERCIFLKRHYGFNEKAMSDEEEEYPLAYGILVHSTVDQVFYMLSSIYQPQNSYCIAVDGNASMAFWRSITYLQNCLPNIIVMKVPPVKWCTKTVLLGVHLCLQQLANSSNNWRYYQYLSGVDLPLRTNHEMVRIFKKLNGSINAEVKPFDPSRLGGLVYCRKIQYLMEPNCSNRAYPQHLVAKRPISLQTVMKLAKFCIFWKKPIVRMRVFG